MTEATVLSATELEAYLPHRGANLLLDELRIAEDGVSSVGSVMVPADDPRGRELFARDDGRGGRCWQEPFLAEILALCGVSLLRERLDALGHEGVFSAISRVEITRPVRMDRPLAAHAHIARDRSGFTQFTGGIEQDGERIVTGEFMSASAPLAAIGAQAPRPDDAAPGDAPVGDFAWKRADMRFIDDVRHWDPAAGRLECGYRYPAEHPLVPGHFPQVAVMMGVTQWLAVADAGVEAATRMGHDGSVHLDGTVTRADGSGVADVRGLRLERVDGVPRIAGCKRVVFREPVRPGDGLRIAVDVVAG